VLNTTEGRIVKTIPRITEFLDFANRPEILIRDLLLSSDEGRESPTLLGPLERANLNYWITHINVYVP
jgi:hypothetical protein